MEEIHIIRYKDCNCFLEYQSAKKSLIKWKCLSCDKDYSTEFNEESKKKFKKKFMFSNNDTNKFILLLRKVVYPYEYMMIGKRLSTLPEKGESYSNWNLKDITDADYMHMKRVCTDYEMNNLGDYSDLYLNCYTLLLADVFDNFRDMSVGIYELDPVKFISAPGLAWQAALKKTQVKLDHLTDADILLMVEKGIRGRICNSIHWYAKTNNKCMDDYDENKESSYINYWDVNNLYGWVMSQRLPTFNFEWVEDTLTLMNIL